MPPITASTPHAAVRLAKLQLRRQVAARLQEISKPDLEQQSERVLAQLFQSPAYLSARSISCYLSLPHSEIQTDALIRHALENGKRIYVPYCPKQDKTVMRMVRLNSLEHFQRLNVNRWGIREVDPDEVPSLEDVDSPASTATPSTPTTTTTTDSDPDGGLDLLIVPGVAFDPYRRRLGHGRGYYDRYINQYCLSYPQRFAGRKNPPRTVALALREQMVQPGEEIPTDEWDRLPDTLITPDGVYE